MAVAGGLSANSWVALMRNPLETRLAGLPPGGGAAPLSIERLCGDGKAAPCLDAPIGAAIQHENALRNIHADYGPVPS